MSDREDEEPKFKMGRLVDDEEEDLLFKKRGSVSFTSFRICLNTHRTVKPRWQNIARGRPGTATYARRSGWTDYQDRTGRFVGRTDLLGLYGDHRALFAEAVNASKDRARRYNDAVVLTGFFPVPKELSLMGQLAVMHFVCDEVRSTGRKCCAAMHDSKHGNRHFHIRATARPTTYHNGAWQVGKGKFIEGPAAMAAWRERFCDFVNAQMEREGLLPDVCRRFYPGPLSDLTSDRPAKRWVSARAYRRDDPDLSRPEDQFSIVWNTCIDWGLDPNQNSFIIEYRAQRNQERDERRAKRQIAKDQKESRRKERIEKLPEVRELRSRIANLEVVPPAEALPPLSEEYRQDVERTHTKNGTPLVHDWDQTAATRAAAEAIRVDVVRRETEARQKADSRAAKRAAAEAKAQAKAEEEEKARLDRIADEEARRVPERAAREAAEQAAKAAYDEGFRRHQEARRQREIEATPKVVIPDAQSIAAHVSAAKGVLRAARDAWNYGQASGKVARSPEAAEFLTWQKDPTLQWIYRSTLGAAKQPGLHPDEVDVLDFARAEIESEIRRRRHEPDSFLRIKFPAAEAHGGNQAPPSGTGAKEGAPKPKEPTLKKALWPWSKKDRGR